MNTKNTVSTFHLLGFKITVVNEDKGYLFSIDKLTKSKEYIYESVYEGYSTNPDQLRAKLHQELLDQYDDKPFSIHTANIIFLGCEGIKDKLDLSDAKKSP